MMVKQNGMSVSVVGMGELMMKQTGMDSSMVVQRGMGKLFMKPRGVNSSKMVQKGSVRAHPAERWREGGGLERPLAPPTLRGH